jgi:dipeptidyl aminopeptidase/acylaminoacyl peptidase
MPRFLRYPARVGIVLLALAMLGGPALASARAFTVDDLLKDEAFGRVLIDPTGRWLVFERQLGTASAARFDMHSIFVRRSRLFRVDLRSPGPAQPLADDDPGAGVVSYGFSPRGTRLAVGRLRGSRWQLGIVTLNSGAVRWLDISPGYAPDQPTLAWIGEDRLLTIAQPDGAIPWSFAMASVMADRLPKYWAAAAAGRQASVTVVGSGRYDGLTPHAASDRLLAIDVATGVATPLATGDLVSITLSPDGRHVALLEQADPVRSSATKLLTVGSDTRRRRLSILDVITGDRWTPCPSCDVIASPPLWSPSGGALLFYARCADVEWGAGTLWRADAENQRATVVSLRGLRPVIGGLPSSPATVAMGWLGRHPVVYARRNASTGRADWFALGAGSAIALSAAAPATSEDLVPLSGGRVMMTGGTALWRLGRPRAPLLTGMDGVLASDDVASADRHSTAASAGIMAWTHGPAETRITLWAARGESVQLLAPPAADPKAASLAQHSAIVIDISPDGEKRLILLRAGAPPTILAAINHHLAALASLPPQPIHYKVPSGELVTGWLYRPVPASDGRKPPLIVIPYAGEVYGDAPPAGWGPGDGRLYTSVPTLVGHGYAVLLPSMPTLAASDHAAFPFAGQVLAAVDAAIATGIVDSGRLGLWGHSFGGFTAATIATQTHRFRAIVASSGVYDLATFRGLFKPAMRVDPSHGQSITAIAGWTETGQPALASSPWTNAARYIANSPVYHADRIATPILLIGGDQDVTPIEQAELLFSALHRQGKDAELLTYWGGDHVLVSPADVRDLYGRIFAWFDGHFDTSSAGTTTVVNAGVVIGAASPERDPARRAPIAPPAPL